MNNKLIKMKLKEIQNRVDNLKNNLDHVKKEKCLECYGGFFAGQYSPGVLSPWYEIKTTEREEFQAYLAETYTEEDSEYLLLYHLTNVDSVISGYYLGLVEGRFQIDLKVVENFSEGCQMVSDTIARVRSAL